MAACLLNNPITRIHQNNGQICRAGAGDHVARVLHVPRCVGNNEPAFRRGKVAVGDVNRDALLPLCAEAVGEVAQVHLSTTGDVGRTLQRFHLVLHDGLGIIKQSADQRGFAVINRAAGVEAQ